MQQTITPRKMNDIEHIYMESHSIPSLLLMELAAQGIVRAMHTLVSSHASCLFLCGPGNNGGDGYAAARLWQDQGGKAMIFELSAVPSTREAQINRNLCLERSISVTSDPGFLSLSTFSLIVDAFYGTGFHGILDDSSRQIFSSAAHCRIPILCVDIPSGLNGESGAASPDTPRAVMTVTFHAVKQGLLLNQGPRHTGRIVVSPIQMLPVLDDEAMDILFPCDLSHLIPSRDPLSHKGSFGRIILYCGSLGMVGAAAMAARAALKCGAGLVTFLCSSSTVPILQTLVPEAMCVSLEVEGENWSSASLLRAKHLLETADCVIAGCGLGRNAIHLPVLEHIHSLPCPVIWDADAICLLADHPCLLPLRSCDFITPHPGEAGRLLGCTAEWIVQNSLHALDALQAKVQCSVILKGARSLMISGERRAINAFSSPVLARGGSGDMLCGILAACSVRLRTSEAASLSVMQSACLIHGLAGMRAAWRFGEDSASPQDILSCLRMDAEDLPPVLPLTARL